MKGERTKKRNLTARKREEKAKFSNRERRRKRNLKKESKRMAIIYERIIKKKEK